MDISKISTTPRDPPRRARATEDFEAFCDAYLPEQMTGGWSTQHYNFRYKLHMAAKHRQTVVVAIGTAGERTPLCIAAAPWAILSEWCKFVLLIEPTEDKAITMMERIKRILLTNGRLLDDFPEVLMPIRQIADPVRFAIQTHHGMGSGIVLDAMVMTLPTVEGSACSGATIRVASINSSFRGVYMVGADGEYRRPDLVIVDDPTWDDSAAERERILNIINRHVRDLGAVTRPAGVLVACTPRGPDDLAERLLDPALSPQWHPDEPADDHAQDAKDTP